MFFSLLRFEISQRLWSFSSLIYFLAYGLLAFLVGLSFAGVLDIGFSFSSSTKLALNSPKMLHLIINLLGYFGLLIVAPIFGQSINKDFETRFHHILFVTPVTKYTYFFVRYIGSAISALLILSSIGIGLWLATAMPFVDESYLIDNRLWFYINPYLIGVIPNILIFGAIFIAIMTLTKKMAAVYITSIVMFVGWMIAESFKQTLENQFFSAITDPFGLTAASQITRYWSIVEQNSQVIPLAGIFLTHRLIWGAVGIVFLALAYLVFSPFALPRSWKRKSELDVSSSLFPKLEACISPIPSNPSTLKIFLRMIWFEFKQAFSNIYFIIIFLCGALYMVGIGGQAQYVSSALNPMPATYLILENLEGSFTLFIMILTAFYAGELVWRDKDSKFSELVDSKPISNISLYLSKLLCLFFLQIFFNFVIILVGILIQMCKGYFVFEFDIYLKGLFFYGLFWKFMVCILALFMHTVAPNKAFGHSGIIFIFVLLQWLPSLGFDHHLYLIGQAPQWSYSAMNGFGSGFKAFAVFTLYWTFFYVGLASVTILLWRRGFILNTVRLTLNRSHFPYSRAVLLLAFVGWSTLGGYIFYNTNIMNVYETASEKERKLAEYELIYKPLFGKAPNLSMASVRFSLDLFPEKGAFKSKGVFTYKNRTEESIKQVLVNFNNGIRVENFTWSKGAHISKWDPRLNVIIYEFDQPLIPDEDVTLTFSWIYEPRGFTNNGRQIKDTPTSFLNQDLTHKVIKNGTYLYAQDLMPTLGYDLRKELISEDRKSSIRKKYGLGDKVSLPNLHDLEALRRSMNPTFDFQAIVSTSRDQRVLSVGELTQEWEEGDRRFFHYTAPKPIKEFPVFLSGNYAIAHDIWQDITIDVYHHPTHGTNVSHMINAVKKSFDYFTTHFSPYPFKHIRIAEIPRYTGGAQAYPGLIPFSESAGFIERNRENDPQRDPIFFITAHEMAHQWWGTQLTGAVVEGTFMLNESLSQYSALMVLRKEHNDPRFIRNVLRRELDRYLRGRSIAREERPLMLVHYDPHIHYAKGALAFYALQDFLGEDTVNRVLRKFFSDFAHRQKTLPRSIDLIERFRQVTPQHLQYLITDLFEKIALYNNRTDSITAQKEGSGFKVTIKAHTQKVYADSLGHETDVPMNDWIDIGFFDAGGKLLYLQKHSFKTGENVITVELDQEPARGGVDPLNILIDKRSDDNEVTVLFKDM